MVLFPSKMTTNSFAEAFADGHLVEKFNDHFEHASTKWDENFFHTSLYKRYFSHVVLGIATSMILTQDSNFENLYHTGDDHVVRIILTKSGNNQAIVNTFFMGNTDMGLLKIYNKQAEFKYLFNDDIKLMSDRFDSPLINIDLQPKELSKLKKLVYEKEQINFENYILEYKNYEISPQFPFRGIKMRKIEFPTATEKSRKLNLHSFNYVHANLNSNAIKKLCKNFIHILNEDPANYLHVKQLFTIVSQLTMKDAHLLTKQNLEPVPHVSKTEIGRAGFFHGVLESLKHQLPFSEIYMKPAIHLRFNGNAWDSDFLHEHKNSILNYAKYGEASFTPQNTFDRPIEQFTQHTTDGLVDQILHPVLYLKSNIKQLLEKQVAPVVLTFQHKTHPTVSEMCKQGIRNRVILVSLRSNFDQWISVSKTLITLHTSILARFPDDENLILKYLQRAFQVHFNFASFRPENLARYLALNILGYLQTPRGADYSSYEGEPKSNPRDESLLNLVLLNSHKKIVCIRFHDKEIQPTKIDHEILNTKTLLPRKQAIIVDVINDAGSLVFQKSTVFVDSLSKYFILKPILHTRLRKSLLDYAYSSRKKYSESVRDTLSTVISMHSRYIKSERDLHAFLDGYSLCPDTLIKLGNYANEYTMAIKIPQKMKKWYHLHKGEAKLEYVTLHFEYNSESDPAKKALENLKNIGQIFKDSKIASFSVLFSPKKVTIACQKWTCNSPDVKSFFCGAARRKRSCTNTQISEPKSGKNLHMAKLSKITHGIQSGFLVRDIIADLLDKDYKSLALTSGLLAASGVTAYLGGKMGVAAIGSCMTNIPFMAYNAIDAYHSFQNRDQFQMYTDLAMIGLDSLCLADGLLFGLTGVPIVGEISFALSTILLISMNIYSSFKLVDALNNQLELSPLEKFQEGIRAFLHMKPEPLIDHLIKGKKADQLIVDQSLSSSQLSENFKYYITAAAIDLDQNGKLIYESDNFIDLRFTIHRRRKSRMMPNQISRANYFCVMDATKDEISIWNTFISPIFSKIHKFQDYYCRNAFGIQFNQNQQLSALYDLFDGDDLVYGFKNVSNFFRLGPGNKKISGGNLDDVFFINSNFPVKGVFVGFSGRNSIDLTKYGIDSRIYVSKNAFQTVSGEKIRFYNISDFIGRKMQPETINISCEFKSVDSKGGDKISMDEIYILKNKCNYDLNIHIHENTLVKSLAIRGNINFIVHAQGYNEIFIGNSTNVSYAFVYQGTSFWDVTFHILGNVYILNSVSGRTKIHTLDHHQEFKFYFLDTILLWNKNHPMAYINSNEPFETLFQKSFTFSQKSGISVTAFSEEINQSLIIATSGLQKANSSTTLVTSNHENHKSQIISLHNGNNVLRISTLSNNLTVYILKNQKMTIDLHHLSHNMLVKFNRQICIKVDKQNFVQDCNVILHIHIQDLITGKTTYIMSILILADYPDCFDNLIIQNYATSSLKVKNQIELLPDDIHLFKKSLIYISAFTVETGSRLISDQNATHFSYYRFKKTLIVSNLHSDTTRDYMTIFFEEYLINRRKFSSLIFEFTVNGNLLKVPYVDNLVDAAIEEWRFHSDYDLSEDISFENNNIPEFYKKKKKENRKLKRREEEIKEEIEKKKEKKHERKNEKKKEKTK
uniref:Uncharacterized protein n=1 Tax=Romanomermis culicivorax TaxID=13658 RepID=A0A915I1C0_ROMCU